MKQTIENLEEQLRLAMIAGNITVLKELIHDDLEFSIPTGDIINKGLDIEGYKEAVKKIDSLSFNSQIIKELDDSIITITNASIKGHYLDIDISGNYSYFRVWVRSGKTWQVIAGQVSILSQ